MTYFKSFTLKRLLSHFFTPSHFKKLILLGSAITLTACSSLGGGSIEKRSAKLSKGIQSAYSISPETANRVSPLIIKSAEQHNLDPLLVAAVIRQESTYRPYVSSPAGAVGLMQIIPRYWQSSCGADLFHEATNVQCGSYILARYQQSAGDLKKGLGYYNVGPSGFENNRKMRMQGKKYAKQVLNHKKMLKNSI
ncbi:transglycosylase SLT domain-containing protein [Acinetobacter schindleri]|uniref:lytic transglycosylase domain-containing protein n=1 Tax=Acinetobacter schindleri TaxID=108981 RepID=UPI002FE05704